MGANQMISPAKYQAAVESEVTATRKAMTFCDLLTRGLEFMRHLPSCEKRIITGEDRCTCGFELYQKTVEHDLKPTLIADPLTGPKKES